LHCHIEALIDNTAHCDCEKQVSNTTDMNQPETAQKISFKEKIPDTVFTTPKYISHNNFITANVSMNASNKNSLLSAGFQSRIFQPPKA